MSKEEKPSSSQPEDKNLCELRKTFYECRNLELKHHWEHSVFLATFITAILAGYFSILGSAIEKFDQVLLLINVQLPLCILALLGFILSILWVLLGKGSKRWFEVYEEAICDIEDKIFPSDKFAKYRMRNLQNYIDNMTGSKAIDDCTFSLSAGKYSPSRINILIGNIFRVFWSIVFIYHSYFIIYLLKDLLPLLDCKLSLFVIIMLPILIVILLNIGLEPILVHIVGSNSTNQNEEPEKTNAKASDLSEENNNKEGSSSQQSLMDTKSTQKNKQKFKSKKKNGINCQRSNS